MPSEILNRDEMRTVADAMAGLGLQGNQEPSLDARNIGFAVTNGSNPKRRSRSVGAFRETDHRMSPIQWRHYRTRSDEIRYLRESADISTGRSKTAESPELAKDAIGDEDDEGTDLEAHNDRFNFGLPAGEGHGQERIGLEERIVTLEIKLMDFEYALSKLQVGSVSPSRRASQYNTIKSQASNFSNNSSEIPPVPNDASPALSQGISRSSSRKFSTGSSAVHSKDRPTSIATTLKPGHNPQNNSFSRLPTEHSSRFSQSGLTVEHYTTLVTLIRHEQSARVRLEEEVAYLREQVERLSTSPAFTSHSHQPSSSQHSHAFSNLSNTFSTTSSNRRHGIVQPDSRRGGHIYGSLRPRSSSYSTNETDTDDENYHDAYVTPEITPAERGEYERGAFERVGGGIIEDGAAF